MSSSGSLSSRLREPAGKLGARTQGCPGSRRAIGAALQLHPVPRLKKSRPKGSQHFFLPYRAAFPTQPFQLMLQRSIINFTSTILTLNAVWDDFTLHFSSQPASRKQLTQGAKNKGERIFPCRSIYRGYL